MKKSAASPDSYISPAAAPQDRLHCLSTLVGIRGTVNSFYELPLFIQAARKPLLSLPDSFSDTVLTEILENYLDRYLMSNPSSDFNSDTSEVSPASPMLVP